MTSIDAEAQTFQMVPVTNKIGTEIRGVQLTQLTQDQIGHIQTLVAERGVLFFRDQEMSLAEQVAVGRRLGELHIHPAVKAPEGYPEILVIHADANSDFANGAEYWHSDVSCDERPPALSMLRMEQLPSAGGDTLFASMYEAYETLSPTLQGFLLTLTATHSGDYPYRHLKNEGGTTRSFPRTSHPIVRTHPISRRRALYVNPSFTEKIDGLRKEESSALLHVLYDQVAYGTDFQVRFRWEPNSVALWDNRCVQHNATWDYFPETRHGYRVTTKGERPFLDNV